MPSLSPAHTFERAVGALHPSLPAPLRDAALPVALDALGALAQEASGPDKAAIVARLVLNSGVQAILEPAQALLAPLFDQFPRFPPRDFQWSGTPSPAAGAFLTAMYGSGPTPLHPTTILSSTLRMIGSAREPEHKKAVHATILHCEAQAIPLDCDETAIKLATTRINAADLFHSPVPLGGTIPALLALDALLARLLTPQHWCTVFEGQERSVQALTTLYAIGGKGAAMQALLMGPSGIAHDPHISAGSHHEAAHILARFPPQDALLGRRTRDQHAILRDHLAAA